MTNPAKTIKDYLKAELKLQLEKLSDPEEVNKLEIAAEAAEEMLRDKHYSDIQLYKELPTGTFFTDEGQDLFNKYYAEALECVEKLPINTRENRYELAYKVIEYWDQGDLISYARDGLMKEYKTNQESFKEDWAYHFEGDEEEE